MVGTQHYTTTLLLKHRAVFLEYFDMNYTQKRANQTRLKPVWRLLKYSRLTYRLYCYNWLVFNHLNISFSRALKKLQNINVSTWFTGFMINNVYNCQTLLSRLQNKMHHLVAVADQLGHSYKFLLRWASKDAKR